MLIDIPVYFGHTERGCSEGGVLVDALQSHVDELYQHGQPDPADMRAVIDFTLTVLRNVVSHTEQYGEGSESDGKGGRIRVYRQVVIDNQPGETKDGVPSGKAVEGLNV